MSRNDTTRTEETKIVKAALKAAGINAEVKHGRGTGWGWLEINVGSSDQFNDHNQDERGKCTRRTCPACQRIQAVSNRALQITQDVTGRAGEYNGRICNMTQRGWRDSTGSYEIVQDPEIAERIRLEYSQITQ